jgi:hypothetical protein
MSSPGPVRHVLTCIECGVLSASPVDFGWKAYRCDDPGLDETPELAFYCPTCARC